MGARAFALLQSERMAVVHERICCRESSARRVCIPRRAYRTNWKPQYAVNALERRVSWVDLSAPT